MVSQLSRPGEPPCSVRRPAFSSARLWLFRSTSYYFRSQVLGMGLPPCTNVRFETHQKERSGTKRGAWAEEKAAATPMQKWRLLPPPHPVLYLLSEPGTWLLEVRSLPHCRPLETPFLLSTHCAYAVELEGWPGAVYLRGPQLERCSPHRCSW